MARNTRTNARTLVARVAAMPKTWYFPTPDPGVVIACDYNAAENRYNVNCRSLDIDAIPKQIHTEMKRSITVIKKHEGS